MLRLVKDDTDNDIESSISTVAKHGVQDCKGTVCDRTACNVHIDKLQAITDDQDKRIFPCSHQKNPPMAKLFLQISTCLKK